MLARVACSAPRLSHRVTAHTHRARSSAAAAAAAAAAAMEKVTFGDNLPGYIVGPKGGPGLIVLQEWWGVTPIIQDQAVKLSEHGFRCLVPDLYKGKVGVDAEEAAHLMNSLDFQNAVQEIKQAVTFLQEKEGCAKVGAVGFCMGGALTLCAAQHAGVAAAAPFYGFPDPLACDITQIKVPVQVHAGALDNHKGFSDPETVKTKVAAMKEAGVNVEAFTYEGCGHAFMNALSPGGIDKIKSVGQAVPPPEAPQLALERVLAFFKANLA